MEDSCRVCLKICTNKSNLEQNVIIALNDIFQINAEPHNSSLFLVCFKCRTILIKFHTFYLQTRKNFNYFKENLGSQKQGSLKEEEDHTIKLSYNEIELKTIVKIENKSDKDDEKETVFFEPETCYETSREIEGVERRKKIKKVNTSCIRKQSDKKESYKCDLCEKTTKRFPDLRSHIEKIHLRLRKYQCHLCGDKFFASNNLKFHLSTHDKERPRSQCKICGVLVLDLKKHFKTSHNNSNPVVCNICGKKLMNEMKLRYHNYKRHPPEGKYKCTICDKDFCNALYLKEHTHQKHIGGFLYTCEWCDFQTNYSKNMPTHQKLKHKEEYEARRRTRPPMLSRVHEMKATIALQSTNK
uniref:CSON003343 protein n=1 Tax=Culicoides sonorensis TaxID=179676 RepID=A0A336LLV2_CULSO